MDARESELCRALLDAYPSREEFEELLDDSEAPEVLLVATAETTASPQQLMDSAYFDLPALHEAMDSSIKVFRFQRC